MNANLMHRRTRRLVAAAVVTPLLAVSAAGVGLAETRPLTWTFDKCAVSGTVWEGSATGLGTTVPLRTELTSGAPTGNEHGRVLLVTFDWQVGEVYLAELKGTLNGQTGGVVMNGTITEGEYAGSQVHEEGQLYDAEHFCFRGTITVLPNT